MNESRGWFLKVPLFAPLLFISAMAVGCHRASHELATIPMRIGHQTFHIEIAATRESQETGLMKRDAMPADHGMIFVFAREEVREFWMKNTRFPLDILFADSGGRVVSIRQMVAYDENLTSSDFPARYAIELNRGAAESAGVKVGDVLSIPDAARAR